MKSSSSDGLFHICRSLDPRLAAESEQASAAPTQVSAALANQAVALQREWEITVGAGAPIDVPGGLAALHRIAMAAMRRQLVYAAHDQLPFLAMGLDAITEDLVGDQVRNFMWHGLAQEVFGIFREQLRVEAQHVLVQMSHAGLLAAQLETDHGPLEGTLKERLGLLEAGFDAGIEQLGHS
jgi:hypothetical protein